jgi:biotin carboxyl carrier protein
MTVALVGCSYRLSFIGPPSAESVAGAHAGAGDGRVVAPMPGKIIKIAVREGERVDERALLVVLEAMKMEHRLEASIASTVKAILVTEGEIVAGGTPLLELGSL